MVLSAKDAKDAKPSVVAETNYPLNMDKDADLHMKSVVWMGITTIFCAVILFLYHHGHENITVKSGVSVKVVSNSGVNSAPDLPTTILPLVAKLPTHSIASFSRRMLEATASISKAPLPPIGTPWKDVYGTLMPRAKSGDGRAANRLLHDTRRCLGYFNIQKSFDYTKHLYDQLVAEDPSQKMFHEYDERLAALQHDLEQDDSVCKDSSPNAVKAALYPVLKQAALLGDQHAIDCYVSGSLFDRNAQSGSNNAAEKNDYMTHLAEFANEGIRNGDWAMVSLLEGAYGKRGPYFGNKLTFLGEAIKPNPLATYYYMLLRRYSLDPETTTRLDKLLSQIARSNDFTDADMVAAQTWADKTYWAYFVDHPAPKDGTYSNCIR